MSKHHSSTLNAVLTNLVPDGSLVLDLGALSSGTTEAFLQKKCRCYVEDLSEYINSLTVANQDPLAALDQHILSTKGDVKFNVILCWDTLNYLSIETINHLFKKLTPHIEPGCILHFIRYTSSMIDQTPRKFRLLNDFTFELGEEACTKRIQNQPHSTAKLLKHFDNFSIRNTVMNQQGMQKDMVEYLLQYNRGGVKKVKQTVAQPGLVKYFVEQKRQRLLSMPALTGVFNSIGAEPVPSILDLGKNKQKNTLYMQQAFDDLHLEDVYASISWQKKINVESPTHLSPNLLRAQPKTPLDLILVWDIFNYCTETQIDGLLELMMPRLKDNTYIHILLYRQKNIPKVPFVFEVMDANNVKINGGFNSDDGVPALHGSVISVVKRFRNWRIVANNPISQEGMVMCQELLLQYRKF